MDHTSTNASACSRLDTEPCEGVPNDDSSKKQEDLRERKLWKSLVSLRCGICGRVIRFARWLRERWVWPRARLES